MDITLHASSTVLWARHKLQNPSVHKVQSRSTKCQGILSVCRKSGWWCHPSEKDARHWESWSQIWLNIKKNHAEAPIRSGEAGLVALPLYEATNQWHLCHLCSKWQIVAIERCVINLCPSASWICQLRSHIRTPDEYVQHFPAESQMFDKWTLTGDMINILGRLSKTRAGCACCCLNLFMSWRPALAGTPIQLVKLTIRSTAVSAASVIQYRKNT